MKIRPEEAQSLHADTDRQPKMTNLISALQQLRQRVPPAQKKRTHFVSESRRNYLRAFLASSEFDVYSTVTDICIAPDITTPYNIINVWIYRTSRLELSSHRDGGRGRSHALVV